MLFDNPDLATLQSMQYLCAVLGAIAVNAELPAIDSKMASSSIRGLDQVCKSATMYYLKNHSTDPTQKPFIEDLFYRNIEGLNSGIKSLKCLAEQQRKFERERFHHEYWLQYLAEMRAKRLSRSKQQYDDELHHWLGYNHTQKNGYYDLLTTDFNALPIAERFRERIFVLHGLVSGKFKSFKEVATVIGKTSSSAQTMFYKEIKSWNHSTGYGTVFDIRPNSPFQKPKSAIFIRNTNVLDDEGFGTWDLIENITFAQAIAIASDRLKELGQTFKVDVKCNVIERLVPRINIVTTDQNVIAVTVVKQCGMTEKSSKKIMLENGLISPEFSRLLELFVFNMEPYAKANKLPCIAYNGPSRHYNGYKRYVVIDAGGAILTKGQRISTLIRYLTKYLIEQSIDPTQYFGSYLRSNIKYRDYREIPLR